MTKYTLLAASLLLVAWSTMSWSQEQTAESGPFDEQGPSAQQGADPFAPRKPDELHEPESSVLQQPSAGAEMVSGDAPEETPVFAADSQSKRSERILRALESPITSAGFHFTETPLSEIVNFLRDEYQIEVQLDGQALDDLGLSPEDTVSVQLRNISLASALKLMLKQHDLTYIVADETLLVTSEDEALSRLSVRVYPVGDLLQRKEGHGPAAASVTDLIGAVISTVASDTWAENGGGEAEIRPLQPGLLIVSQTQAVHEEIANLLMALRRARAHELALPYAPVAHQTKRSSGGGFGGGGGRFGGGGRDTSGGQKPEEEKSATPERSRGGGAF